MPLYEYQCKSCEQLIEVLQKFSDDPLRECENCGGELKKLLSAPAVQFKGTGWYVTDYAGKKGGGESSSKKSGSAKKGDSGSSSDSGNATGSSSESKPAKASSSSGDS